MLFLALLHVLKILHALALLFLLEFLGHRLFLLDALRLGSIAHKLHNISQIIHYLLRRLDVVDKGRV